MSPLSDKELDQLATGYGADFDPDVEAGLARLRRRIDHQPRTAQVRRMGRRNWWAAAAAALLLVSVAYFGLFYQPETELANDSTAPRELTLPDGTEVVLQQGSRLTLAADYNETERRISLDGQAFFVVHPDAERPFLTEAGATQLRVTGTEFNLRVDGSELEVEVSEGSVELQQDNEKLAVAAHQCGIAKPGKPLATMAAPFLNRHAWRTGKLHFRDANLPAVVEALRTNYGLEVALPPGCDYAVSGTFPGEDPVAVLRNVAKLGGGRVESGASANTFRLVDVCK